MNKTEMIEQIIQNKIISKQLSLEYWVQYEVFTWQWWIGVAFVIIPLLLWWKLVDRRRLLQIIAFGFLVNTLATFLDIVGSELVLWYYTIRVLPQFPLLFPVDFIMVPIIYMLIYQRFNTWQQFLLTSTIAALALAFVAEPLAVFIHQYQLINWEFIYSVPIYVLIATIGKIFADKMSCLQEQSLKVAASDETEPEVKS